VPVTAADFADPTKRAAWVRDKHMTVLNFWSESHRDTPIDVFVIDPFDFETEYARALVKPLAESARPGRDADARRQAWRSRKESHGEMKRVTLSVAHRQTVKQRALDAFSGKRRGRDYRLGDGALPHLF
jgi:hypothetical protein